MFERISAGNKQNLKDLSSSRNPVAELSFEIFSEKALNTGHSQERIRWSLSSKTRPSDKIGTPINQAIRLQSSGSLFCIKGRSVHYRNGVVWKEENFDVCLDDSQLLETLQNSGDTEDEEFQGILRNQSGITLRASNFLGNNSPVSAISLRFIVGEYNIDDVGYRPILLCKGIVEMKVKEDKCDEGKAILLDDNVVEYSFADITLLTSAVSLPTSPRHRSKTSNLDHREPNYIWKLPKVLLNILILTTFFLIVFQPMGGYHENLLQVYHLSGLDDKHLWTLNVICYFIEAVRITSLLVVFLIFIATPTRYDYFVDFPIYLSRYIREILLLEESPGGRMSFFVHAWNAWGYCGAVRQGRIIRIYSMPHVCVKAFHSGGPALMTNLGRGKDRRTIRNPNQAYSNNTGDAHSPHNHSHREEKEKGDIKCRDYIASDMFGALVDIEAKKGIVCGFLSQARQFGCVSVNKSYEHMSVHVTCDGAVLSPKGTGTGSLTGGNEEVLRTDWLFVQLQSRTEEDPLGAYLQLAGQVNKVHELFRNKHYSAKVEVPCGAGDILGKEGGVMDIPDGLKDSRVLQSTIPSSKKESKKCSEVTHQVPSGWCSWYHFFEHVSELHLMNNISSMLSLKAHNRMDTERMGFSLFQVDDGYQRAWGDWLQLHLIRFPSQSMHLLVTSIKEASMTPGIWMAPFACDKHSDLAKNHPDWILTRKRTVLDFTAKGQRVPANSANCGKWFYGLDVTNPEVRAHVKKCISTATAKWGFQYLKLDFLYAAALGDTHDSYFDRSLTRAQAMVIGLDTISEAMGESVFLLGCGAPMGSVLGRVHANRVSSDAGLSWLPDPPLPSHDTWNLPCARNMVRNSICRMTMHGRWWINDPDCILLRDSTNYSEVEMIGIATLKAMSGGSFIISDDLATVSSERLRLAQQLLPASNVCAIPLDLMEREIPQVLRLQLGADRVTIGAISCHAGSHVKSCLDNWTVLGDCNWGDTQRSNIITAEQLNVWPDESKVTSDNEEVLRNKTIQGDTSVGNIPHENENNFQVLHMLEFWSSSYSHRILNKETKNESSLGGSIDLTDNSQSTHLRSADDKKRNGVTCVSADLRLDSVTPHSAKLYALRLSPLRCRRPVYVGSNLHFSSGLEVRTFSYNRSEGMMDDEGSKVDYSDYCLITFQHCSVRCEKWNGYVWLYLPHCPVHGAVHEHEKSGGTCKKERDISRPLIGGSLAGCEGPNLVDTIMHPFHPDQVLGCVWRISLAIDSHSVLDDLSIHW